MKNSAINIRIDNDMKEAVKNIANANSISISQYVCDAVRKSLEEGNSRCSAMSDRLSEIIARLSDIVYNNELPNDAGSRLAEGVSELCDCIIEIYREERGNNAF